ncbi:MAG: hypothetical protein ABI351_13890 [Herbaspirillum sp.]
MNKKTVIYVIGGVAGVYILFKMMSFMNQNNGVNPSSAGVSGSLSSYPVTAANSPRVDNSNQPWYNQLVEAVLGTSKASSPQTTAANPTAVQQNAASLSTAASVGSSLSSLYSTLGVGNWFSSATASNNLTDTLNGGLPDLTYNSYLGVGSDSSLTDSIANTSLDSSGYFGDYNGN